MHHSDFAQMTYSEFFQLCRTHGVGFDVRKKQGSIFTLLEGNQHEHLGLITISDSVDSSRTNFISNLKTIYEGITPKDTEGRSNFKVNEETFSSTDRGRDVALFSIPVGDQ